MKRIKLEIIGYTLIAQLFVFAQNSFSQLHNIQKSSVWTPVNLKIDGQPNEWGHFQAYNHATSLYYTIANDEKNIYVAFQTSDFDALSKITNTGIVCTFQSLWNTDKDQRISVTYPYFEIGSKPFINFKSWPKISSKSPRSKLEADSFMTVANKRLEQKSKYIKTYGIKEVDTLISIYNEQGIKGKQGFNNQMVYTCELMIPLVYLNKLLQHKSGFHYHVELPGLSLKDFGAKREVVDGEVTFSFSEGAVVPPKVRLQATFSTTDFSGEYTLAKAP